MRAESIERVLGNFFSKSTTSDWKKIAMQETQGKDPFEILSWHGKDDILFLPYYDEQDVAGLTVLKAFQKPASENSLAGPRTWVNLPAVYAHDPEIANSLAGEHLSSGADGVLFDVHNFQQADLKRLLHNIESPRSFLGFRTNNNEPFPHALSALIEDTFNPASVSGALFWESIPKKSNLEFFFNRCANFKSLGLTIPASSPAAEISHALLEGVKALEAFGERSAFARVLRSICFSVTADASILETVVKLKVLRGLWAQVALAYGDDDYNLGDLHIHARSVSTRGGAYMPHENMLHATFSAMAAVMGGCDSLTIESEEQPAMVRRWARNVSSILREESFLGKVRDPLAGSYTLESMMDKTARKAWESFQNKWRDYAA